MRRLIWFAVAIALGFCAWWIGASLLVNQSITTWFEDRRAVGWQAEMAGVSSSGFPARIITRIDAPELADPATGLAVSLDEVTLAARALWPGDVSVLVPNTPIQVATPQARWTLLAETAQADLNLHPGTALELENLSLVSGPFMVNTADGASVIGGDDLTLALSQSDTPETYAVTFDIKDFSPGDLPRTVLILPDDWSRVFDILRVDAVVRFDSPIDRRTLEQQRPQPRQIDLSRAEAQWGDMRFLATGSMIADAQSRAEGTLTIKAENWQQMLALAETSGLLPTEFRPQAENILRMLASGTGKTNDIDITLTFDDGLTKLGIIPIGPAPSLKVR